jgi:hypothetical protein
VQAQRSVGTVAAVKGRHAAALVLVVLTIPAGCGSESGDSGDSAGSGGAEQSNGVESKSAEQILEETAAALGRVKTFHIEGSQAGTDLQADVGLPQKLSLQVREKGGAASIIVLNGSLYLKANAEFWKDQGERAGEFAGRWFKMPASAKEFRDLTEGLSAKTLSRCLPKDHGTLTKQGRATVDGRPAVVIADKGDRPGSAPGKLFVATKGEPLPLRMTATDKTRPGGDRDPRCEDESPDTGDKVDIIFSNYNEPLDLKAPPSAVELGPGTAS